MIAGTDLVVAAVQGDPMTVLLSVSWVVCVSLVVLAVTRVTRP